jgi:hypothetical protein
VQGDLDGRTGRYQFSKKSPEALRQVPSDVPPSPHSRGKDGKIDKAVAGIYDELVLRKVTLAWILFAP